MREEEGKDQGGAGEGPASLPLGVSLFVHGLLPICLCSHLRGHLGNQMKCQAQGRASEQPRQSSASSDLAGQSGSLQTNRWAHVASHASPSLSSAHRLSVDLEREERKRPSQKPWASFFLSLSFSFTRSHTHTHTSVGRGAPGQEAPLGRPTVSAFTPPSTHRAAAGAPSTGGQARFSVRTALLAGGLGTRHLEVLLSMFEAPVPSGHCPRAQPARGAREQGDICERERQRRQSSFR